MGSVLAASENLGRNFHQASGHKNLKLSGEILYRNVKLMVDVAIRIDG